MSTLKAPPVILASASAARKEMLSAAGLVFEAEPAKVDEAAIIKKCERTHDIKRLTSKLAQAKALSVSQKHPDALVIGSDQTLEFEGKLLTKAKDLADAEEKLKSLRGKTHILRSAVCVAHSETILFSISDSAHLTMHNFDDDFLVDYMQRDPDALTSCVGGYKIEGAGAWLFSDIKGDNFTIMGMPLLPLLGFLRSEYGIKP
ncbi:MAG: Maf family protein [Alphaproteobacteria bacterium]